MKYFKIVLTLLMNRAFVSACLTVIGIILTSVYGRALGFTGALTTDLGKKE